MPILEPERTPDFAKQPGMEALKAQLNACIASLEHQAFPAPPDAPVPPKIFIVGLPHCGTTLAGQLLASVGAYSYISNIMANFWMAPVLGAMVEKVLGFSQENFVSSFNSTHGATEGLAEPHEFGYFWNRWFELGQDTHKLSPDQLRQFDGTSLQSSVNELACFTRSPLVFKNNTWCNFHIPLLHSLFPDSIFVYCQREYEFCAQSLLTSRIRRYNDRNSWWSIRPPNYAGLKDLPWAEQIAGQIYYSEQEIASGIRSIPADSVVVAKLSAVCAHPAGLVEDIQARLRGYAGLRQADTGRLPENLDSRDSQRVDDSDWAQLRNALDRVFTEHSETAIPPLPRGPT